MKGKVRLGPVRPGVVRLGRVGYGGYVVKPVRYGKAWRGTIWRELVR